MKTGSLKGDHSQDFISGPKCMISTQTHCYLWNNHSKDLCLRLCVPDWGRGVLQCWPHPPPPSFTHTECMCCSVMLNIAQRVVIHRVSPRCNSHVLLFPIRNSGPHYQTKAWYHFQKGKLRRGSTAFSVSMTLFCGPLLGLYCCDWRVVEKKKEK